MSVKKIQKKTKPSASVTWSVVEKIERPSQLFDLGHNFKEFFLLSLG